MSIIPNKYPTATGQNATNQVQRILVFRGGALGDFILTIPALSSLRRRRPGTYLELAGYEKTAGLALTAGLVDRLRPLDSARMALYFQSACALPPEEKKYIRSFDLIVSYLHDPEGILLNHLKDAGAKNIVAVSPLVKSGHASEHFYNPIRNIVGDNFEHGNCKKAEPHSQPQADPPPAGLGRPWISAGQGCPALPAQTIVSKTWSHFIKCDHGSGLPRKQLPLSSVPDFQERPDVLLEWPHVLKEKARRRLCNEIGNKKAVIIHPGSGSPAKNWPAEKFAALAGKIRNETDFEPLVIGGEADVKEITCMRSLLPDFHIHDNLPLLEVASILSAAGGFVGNDSGITHLAAALGIPTVALFGPTDPAIWAPRGKNVSVIKSRLPSRDSLSEIGIEAVFQALIKTLDDN